MNGKDLLLGMSFLSDELVQEADTQPLKKSLSRWKWVGLAACLCLILGAGAVLGGLSVGMDTPAPESAVFDNEFSLEYGAGGVLSDSPLYSENSIASQINGADSENCAVTLTDFGLRLVRTAHSEEKNTLISPLSVAFALGMTANGAQGETLAQMENTLGIPADALNLWLRDYSDSLPDTDGGRLLPANAIWYRNGGLQVNDVFLRANEKYYHADIRASGFDQETLKEINSWVNDNTKGMIPSILNQIDPDAVMYLVNALAFEAKWASVYREDQVYRDIFTTAGGDERTLEFLHSQEQAYLENENATGFIKYYKDHHYAFVALLPKEGTTVAQLLESLDGPSLNALLASPEDVAVFASIPKFKTEYSVELSGILREMGMELPFDQSQSDFSGIGDPVNGTNIYISQVIHKTFLQLDEQGTRAGAATAVAMYANGALMEAKYVDLNRPFVYMLLDVENGLPFFIGCMADPEV